MNGTGWPPTSDDLAVAALRLDVDRLAQEQALMREQLDSLLAVVRLASPVAADDPYPAPSPRQPRPNRALGRLISRDT